MKVILYHVFADSAHLSFIGVFICHFSMGFISANKYIYLEKQKTKKSNITFSLLLSSITSQCGKPSLTFSRRYVSGQDLNFKFDRSLVQFQSDSRPRYRNVAFSL